MCWMCDNPSATAADARAHQADLLDRFGWMVQGVEAEDVHAGFAYTVGLTAHTLPEFVVHGLDLERATQLLNDLASDHVGHAVRMKAGDHFYDGITWFRLENVARPADELFTAVEFFGSAVRALTLVPCDPAPHPAATPFS